jgi:very-short-patch-repair endonuclease
VKRLSVLEETLWLHLRAAGISKRFEREFHAIPERKLRWGFAEPSAKLLIECEGQIWIKGAHSSGVGITRDIEKGNAATLAGYRTLRFSREMIEDGRALADILEALGMCRRA